MGWLFTVTKREKNQMSIVNVINWINAEPQETVLQRDGVYALLSWRDFNQPEESLVNARTIAWMFILGAGFQALMLS